MQRVYGFTETAIVLAVGTVIGVIVNSQRKASNQLPKELEMVSRLWGKRQHNSPRSHRDYRQLHIQDCRVSDQFPRKECLASYPRSRCFHD